MAHETPPELGSGPRMPLYRRIGETVARIDRFAVDGIINACGFLIFAAAEGLRTLHNGKVQVALIVALTVLVATLIAVMLGLPSLFQGTGGSHMC